MAIFASKYFLNLTLTPALWVVMKQDVMLQLVG
jgi:hypothetical protein